MAERIQKLIAEAGIASRRKAEKLMLEGKVKVNGVVVTELGTKATGADRIEVIGVEIKREEKVYYLMNKPRKALSTVSDDRGRTTVIDYMPEVNARVFPVGRLDYDSTGVLIMTNDGDFANKMMHPRYHIGKIYEVAIDGILTPDEVKVIKKGVPLEDGLTAPASVHIISMNMEKGKTVFSILLHEGKNREIRRMMEYFNHNVTRLDRKKYGFLDYSGLRQGQYRRLRKYEVKQLMKMCDEGEDAIQR